MRKLLIAALLGGVAAMPAQAELFIEISGSALSSRGTSSALLYGYCTQTSCISSFDIGVFRLSYGSGGWYSGEANFTFDDSQSSHSDGNWYTGSGYGFYSYGDGEDFEFVSLTFNKIRLTPDNDFIRSDTNPSVSFGKLYPLPEPATWAMMIGGFALAGAVLRRRRYRVAFV